MALQIIAAYFYQDDASSESSSNLHLRLERQQFTGCPRKTLPLEMLNKLLKIMSFWDNL